jgi:beta-xylosidase
MNFMDEATLLAHALRDFLRPIAGISEVKWMDLSLNAGEPVASLMAGLSICQQYEIALPPIFESKMLTLESLSAEDISYMAEQFADLPAWWQQAS